VSILKELNTRDVKILSGIYVIARQRAAPVWAATPITGVEFHKNDLVRLFGQLGLSNFPNPLHITQAEADANRALVDADDRNFGYSMDVLTRNRLLEENFKSTGNDVKDFAMGGVTETNFTIESIWSDRSRR
jgi:hypothetical protein